MSTTVNAKKAEYLTGVNERQIRRAIKGRLLRADRRGHEWAIDVDELERVYGLKYQLQPTLEERVAVLEAEVAKLNNRVEALETRHPLPQKLIAGQRAKRAAKPSTAQKKQRRYTLADIQQATGWSPVMIRRRIHPAWQGNPDHAIKLAPDANGEIVITGRELTRLKAAIKKVNSDSE